VTVFLFAGLLPLLTLAYFTARSTTLGIDGDITTSGLASLQVARRVAEDYLTVTGPEEGGPLDDDVVYWLSRVVRQDINVYAGADLLATSTRELYSSGLLNERLNGESYREIYLEGEPFWLAEDRTVGLDYLTLSAPMRIDRQGTIGLISIPLLEHRYAAARKEEDVLDAVLIVTCFAVLLLALVGHVLAVRVSRPITLLMGAARRVAGGDLEVRVEATASDETGLLVEAFNRMAASLRQQRQDLRRHTDYIEKILKSATTGVVSIDGSGTIITVNPAAQALLAGGAGAPGTGDDLTRHLEGDPALAPLLSALRRALAGRVEREVEVAFAGRREAGAAGSPAEGPRRVRAVFIPFAPEEDRPPGLIVLLEDVTEIVRSGRLAAWAEMARRVAHEIKNPLTPILLSVEHVRRVFKAKDARFERILPECLDNIQKQVEVLRQIAFEFSTYARLPHLQPEPVPVGELLDEALGPYTAAAPAGIQVRRDVPSGLPRILVDRAIMVRALVNLIENALQAMPQGGALLVSARPADGPSGEARVAIEVRDTGCGIPEALLPRLFEPYFSTKSGGTGLGLGLARRAVEEHGGTIEVRSREGSGTVVTLALPAAPAGAGPGAAP
ncbi:MAG: ATP-binding protein, partial [Acidobacteriota bacterium]